MTDYLLAFDLGTTGNKAILLDPDTGIVVASATTGYSTVYTPDGGAEQSPDDWWQSTVTNCRTLKEFAPDAFSQIAGIACGGMMNGVVLVDHHGNAIRDSIIHADTRSISQCRSLALSVGTANIFEQTANRLDPHLSLPKLCWLRENEPAILSHAASTVQAKDYLAGRLTGVTGVTDPSDASLTGGFHIASRTWVTSLWEEANLPASLLPRVVSSTEIIGSITPSASRELGLVEGTPVVMGGGDGACASAGSGALLGQAYNYLGGTSWIGLVRNTPLFDDRLGNYCLLDDHVLAFGTVQAAGSAVEWVSSLFGPENCDPAELDREARAIPPGSERLFFLPYLQGERSPLWDADARGVFFGLASHHGRAHLFRATLEGVAYALLSILDVYAENGEAIPSLRVLGGGAKSDLWRAILSSVIGRPLRIVRENTGATSIGAALAAGVGIGIYPSLTDAVQQIAIDRDEFPDPDWLDAYGPYEEFFRSLYPVLKERFAALAQL